jgi:2-deoxy-D-gluconate 3-dehydrogenase
MLLSAHNSLIKTQPESKATKLWKRRVYLMAKTIAQLFDLSGKGAVVTGGAMGIGQSIAYRLAEAGAGVTVADIDFTTATKTVDKIKGRGGKSLAIKADVRSSADAEKVIQATLDAFGNLSILVNNAGIYPSYKFLNTTDEGFDEIIDVNLKGVLKYSQAAARVMIKAGNGGKIINIASNAGLRPEAAQSPYSVSKSGVIMLTKTMAVELAHYNILVNAIAPGGILTPGGDKWGPGVIENLGMPAEKVLEAAIQRVPLGRLGTPDEIATAVLFLASGASGYVVGQVLGVDGGFLLS